MRLGQNSWRTSHESTKGWTGSCSLLFLAFFSQIHVIDLYHLHRRIIVEDVATEGDEEACFARRMVFVDNSNLIQSEARLCPCSHSAGSSKISLKDSKKKMSKKPSPKADFPQLELDHSVLAMDYHKHIVAGILSSKLSLLQKTAFQFNIQLVNPDLSAVIISPHLFAGHVN